MKTWLLFNFPLSIFLVLLAAVTGRPGGPGERPWTSTASSPDKETHLWATALYRTPLSLQNLRSLPRWWDHSQGWKTGGRSGRWDSGWSVSPGLWAVDGRWVPLLRRLWEGWSTSHVWSRGWRVATKAARGTAAVLTGRGGGLTKNHYCLLPSAFVVHHVSCLLFSVAILCFFFTSSAWNRNVTLTRINDAEDVLHNNELKSKHIFLSVLFHLLTPPPSSPSSPSLRLPTGKWGNKNGRWCQDRRGVRCPSQKAAGPSCRSCRRPAGSAAQIQVCVVF